MLKHHRANFTNDKLPVSPTHYHTPCPHNSSRPKKKGTQTVNKSSKFYFNIFFFYMVCNAIPKFTDSHWLQAIQIVLGLLFNCDNCFRIAHDLFAAIPSDHHSIV